MNTHLHILEPYTNLYRIWKNPTLEEAQRKLIDIFRNKILNPQTYHLNLFFDENWTCKSKGISFGHDIEASWLLNEAAEVLDDPVLHKTIQSLSLKNCGCRTGRSTKGWKPDLRNNRQSLR